MVNLHGAPADRERLRDMTSFMAFRGPDGMGEWSAGSAALGHTMLRTTFEARDERQPESLEGQIWITADARIDARATLREHLAARGRSVAPDATDAQLILHSYHVWGETCVAHLLGDFAFAVWDAPRRKLFCARDPFGVKPFFYAHAGECLLFSNTLNCIRTHPAISGELDELSIADFLLFELNQDPAATSFRDIRRLPPAHCLTASSAGVRVREYWTLPLDTLVRYRDTGDYVEHFKELLEVAVADRMRTDRIGIELTGGLDSTSIAATALAALAHGAPPCEVSAHTIVYDRLIPDDERRFAAMAAERLAIPIHFFAADECALYENRDGAQGCSPEPSHDPGAAGTLEAYRRSAAHGRVMLTGWDGDALFNESPKPYLRTLMKDGHWARLAAGVVGYGVSQRRLVPLSVRAWFKNRGRVEPVPAFPSWVEPSLEARLGLRARWEHAHNEAPVTHPVRPYAFRTLASIMRMSSFFEYADAGVTRVPLEHRHPLMDLRLQAYCLSLPPLPWCVKKEIVRRAMRGVLPEPVRRRPKTPLAGWPEMELLHRPEAQWIDRFEPAPQLARYVDRARIPLLCARPVLDQFAREVHWRDLRPLSLDFWLRGLQGAPA